MPIRANMTYRGISFRIDQPGSVGGAEGPGTY